MSFLVPGSHPEWGTPVLGLFSLLLSGTISRTFLIFEDLGSLDEYSPGILQNVPQFRAA